MGSDLDKIFEELKAISNHFELYSCFTSIYYKELDAIQNILGELEASIAQAEFNLENILGHYNEVSGIDKPYAGTRWPDVQLQLIKLANHHGFELRADDNGKLRIVE